MPHSSTINGSTEMYCLWLKAMAEGTNQWFCNLQRRARSPGEQRSYETYWPELSLLTNHFGGNQGYRNESRDVEELGPHALRKRALKSGRKPKEKASKANPLCAYQRARYMLLPCSNILPVYHGDRARFHYFQCQQLILRMQVQALIKLWHLPAEFEVF